MQSLHTVLHRISYFGRMKVTSLLVGLLLLGATAQGQSKKRVFFPEPGEGISYNASSLLVLGGPSSFTPDWRANSQEFQVFREHSIALSHFSVAYGLGYSAHYYHGNLHIHVNPDGTQSLQDLTGTSYKRNRFALEFVDAVLEFRYRSTSNNKGRYTRLYVGGLFGYRADAYSYQEAENYRVKFYNIDGFNRYRYGVYAKLGRGPWNLYGYYGLNPLASEAPLLPDFSGATSANLGLSFTL